MPRTSVQPTTCTGARRTIRPVRSRTASRVTTQSRVRVRSIAASTTTAELAVVASCTWRPTTGRAAATPCAAARTGAGSPTRSSAPPHAARCCRPAASARRSAAGSAARRRCRALWGGLRSSRRATTMSRTLPIDSPLGPEYRQPGQLGDEDSVGWRHEDQVKARGAQLHAGGVRSAEPHTSGRRLESGIAHVAHIDRTVRIA